MKPSTTVYKRCRPLLGTFVEISLGGVSEASAFVLFEKAYSEISRICREMSLFDPKSKLSRLNRSPMGTWKKIGIDLANVLSLSLKVQERSGGIFNVAVADPLILWNVLPGKAETVNWEDLKKPGFEVGDGCARRLLPVRIDLGGIAKGYAVDKAVEEIQRQDKNAWGCVNAGGDLRVFGEVKQSVWVRTTVENETKLYHTSLENQSLATSTVIPRGAFSPYVDLITKNPVLNERTAIVRARLCVLADAITKVVLLAPHAKARKLAADFGAYITTFPDPAKEVRP